MKLALRFNHCQKNHFSIKSTRGKKTKFILIFPMKLTLGGKNSFCLNFEHLNFGTSFSRYSCINSILSNQLEFFEIFLIFIEYIHGLWRHFVMFWASLPWETYCTSGLYMFFFKIVACLQIFSPFLPWFVSTRQSFFKLYIFPCFSKFSPFEIRLNLKHWALLPLFPYFKFIYRIIVPH